MQTRKERGLGTMYSRLLPSATALLEISTLYLASTYPSCSMLHLLNEFHAAGRVLATCTLPACLGSSVLRRLSNGGPRKGWIHLKMRRQLIHSFTHCSEVKPTTSLFPPHSQNQTGRGRQPTRAHNDTTTGVRPQSKSISIILIIILIIPSPHPALLNISKHCQLQPMRQTIRMTRLVHLSHEAVITTTLRGSLLTPLVCSSTRRRPRANLDYGNCHGVHRRRHDPAQDHKNNTTAAVEPPARPTVVLANYSHRIARLVSASCRLPGIRRRIHIYAHVLAAIPNFASGQMCNSTWHSHFGLPPRMQKNGEQLRASQARFLSFSTLAYIVHPEQRVWRLVRDTNHEGTKPSEPSGNARPSGTSSGAIERSRE